MKTIQRIAAGTILSTALAALPAEARFIRVDAVGQDNGLGELWSNDTFLNLDDGGPRTVSLGFTIEIAAGVSVDTVSVFENGLIEFGSGEGSLQVFAPAAGTIESSFETNAGVSLHIIRWPGQLEQGNIYRNTSGPRVLERATRIHWNQINAFGAPGDLSFQSIFVDLGGGNFDLEINFDRDVAAGLGSTDMVVGSESIFGPYAGPFSDTVDYDFSFRDGSLVRSPFNDGPVSVPESETLSLLLLGLAIAGFRARTRFRY